LDCSVAAAQAFSPPQTELSSAVHLDEADSAVRAQLEQVRANIANSQWDEGVELLRRLMENSGGKLMAIAESRYIPLADYCQALIAGLPAPALELYRQRVDSQAAEWLQKGLATRNAAQLEKVTRQAFASSVGDQALLALGDLALEQGHAARARSVWEQILELPPETVPAARYDAARAREGLDPAETTLIEHWYQADRTPDPPIYRLRRDEEFLSDQIAAELVRYWKSAGLPPSGLQYPSTSLPLAEVRARLVLASILEGSLERAGKELAAFERYHGATVGQLAGRRGPLVETLRATLNSASDWPALPSSRDWSTFAGEPDRNKLTPEPLDLGPAAWPPIDLGEPIVADITNSRIYSSRRIAEDAQGLLSYHPLVVGDLLLVSKQNQIFAFNLYTGKPAWPGGANQKAPGEFFTDDAPLHAVRMNRGLGVPRFTMTADSGRLYARTGSQVTSHPLESQEAAGGHLVCLDLEAQGRLCWKISPDDERWSFGGAPLVRGADVYITMRKSDVRPQEHVACFDAETGRRRWRTMIASAETPGGGVAEEMSHNLLTLAEGSLYCNTNLGAVAALDPRDGRIEWVKLYHRSRRTAFSYDQRAAHFYRDLNPAVFYRGELIVAPADSEAIFALDAGSGQMVWESYLAEDAVHILGVGAGSVLASGDRLWWIDAAGGKALAFWLDETRHGYGRGLLAGGQIYWPTRDMLYVFEQQLTPGRAPSVKMVRQPIPLAEVRGAEGGNLIPADRILLNATKDKIYGFLDNSWTSPLRHPAARPKTNAGAAGNPLD
jgi:outer membrane protein assembly factor BamB